MQSRGLKPSFLWNSDRSRRIVLYDRRQPGCSLRSVQIVGQQAPLGLWHLVRGINEPGSVLGPCQHSPSCTAQLARTLEMIFDAARHRAPILVKIIQQGRMVQ